jgi:hypothetical protein
MILSNTQLHEGFDWRCHLIVPTTKKHPLNEFAPDVSGIYGLYSKEGALRYIGKSIGLERRIRDHWNDSMYGRRSKFYAWSCVPIPKEHMTDIETAHIVGLQTIDNKRFDYSKNTNHMDMVDAIRAAWGLKPWKEQYESDNA